ncbi:hypothetical protein ACRALDRAFT_207811 [Sodiomyces alcalophilus JCM 7366]|uniref:uncharacterized protein n=1 Tax=Sodiomyces alcalophilus JCM 7366 TaxID=591952 RepID=UPI0039B496FD
MLGETELSNILCPERRLHNDSRPSIEQTDRYSTSRGLVRKYAQETMAFLRPSCQKCRSAIPSVFSQDPSSPPDGVDIEIPPFSCNLMTLPGPCGAVLAAPYVVDS